MAKGSTVQLKRGGAAAQAAGTRKPGGFRGAERLVKRRAGVPFLLREFHLDDATDSELVELSRKMGIGLSKDEMKRVQAHFQKLGRPASDVELEALGQAWSEHCCYKSSKPILKEHVYGIHEHKLFAREDAGVLPFDDNTFYVVKIESHNHPSAVEPYGGAATGIGGVVRDVLCMGAQPIALVDPLFFGPLDLPREKIPEGVRSPRYLFSGVVAGIRDYGNRIGIPTVAGQVNFHPGYVSNPLVQVGCVGVMPKKNYVPSKASAAGDVYMYAGGKTGRDGIHGVTFASAELHEASEESGRGAVQLGDPITKEPLIHATLECVEKGLLVGLKDLGGGGLSCVCSELAHDAGLGADVEMDKVPTKEPNMAPWEIWVSESQERMLYVARPENVDRVLQVCAKWDVTCAAIGKVTNEKVVRVTFQGHKVLEQDLAFQTGGPVYDRPKKIRHVNRDHWLDFDAPDDLAQTVVDVLADPNVASKEWLIRMYDHEVRGNTVLKPLQGVIGKAGPGDAAVLKPLPGSWRGLAITTDVNPFYMELDPYWGARSAVDEVARNVTAVGGRLDSIADGLNAGNPEKPERLGDFYESVRGLGDACRGLGIPFASGNVSLYNEGPGGSVPSTPALLGIGIVDDIRQVQTTDFKRSGNSVWLVGDTFRELGGSAYLRRLGLHGKGERVPQDDLDRLKASMDSMLDVLKRGIIKSSHDLSEGGLATGLAEMCIGGDVGCEIDVSAVGNGGDSATGGPLRFDHRLFAESNMRWLVELRPGDEATFQRVFDAKRVPVVRLGEVGGPDLNLTLDGDEANVPVDRLRDAWTNSLYRRLV